jgi:hypothetical protein
MGRNLNLLIRTVLRLVEVFANEKVGVKHDLGQSD